MRGQRSLLTLVLLSSATFASGKGASEKDDVVVMGNGDRITGEILSLEYGELSVKTNYMGTVLIEWVDVASVLSDQNFIIEDTKGHHYSGVVSAEDAADSVIAIVVGGERMDFPMESIARLAPEGEAFLSRLEGSFSLGFDFAKSSDIQTISGTFNTLYRAPEFIWNLSADVNSTTDPIQGTLDRDTLRFSYQWLRARQRFFVGLAALERNEETGIEARAQFGGGIGKYIYQSARSEVTALIGATLTNEWATGVEGRQQSVEGVLGGTWRVFRFNTPKVSLSSTAVVYPSITESGRYRSNLNMSLRREIVKDFYLDLSFYQTYDSDPPDDTAEKDDYGITTSLGYSFH